MDTYIRAVAFLSRAAGVVAAFLLFFAALVICDIVVERYILNPGQATSYKVGMITIQKLRDEAKAALGDKFDYRTFHDAVLGGGALPMPVLQAKVRRWIEAQRKPPA